MESVTEPATSIDGFTEWVAARGQALQRFAWFITGKPDDAADLVQDALAAALPKWSSLVQANTAEAYVRRAIVNGSISRWRKLGRVVPLAEVDPGVIPDHADRVDDADLAWQLCTQLPPNQRAAVVLRFYDDLSFAQIATILDCSEATARSHVHRALTALRSTLEQDPR